MAQTEKLKTNFGVEMAGSPELSWTTRAVPSMRHEGVPEQSHATVCKNRATEPTMFVSRVYLSHAMLRWKIDNNFISIYVNFKPHHVERLGEFLIKGIMRHEGVPEQSHGVQEPSHGAHDVCDQSLSQQCHAGSLIKISFSFMLILSHTMLGDWGFSDKRDQLG